MPPETEGSTLRKEDYELLAEFRYTLRSFLRFSESAARRCQMTPQQYVCLLSIEGFPGRSYATLGELAARLQITDHSAVGLVDRLEKRGFVLRTPAKEDRRKVWVSLTPAGLQRLEQLYLEHRRELQSIGPQLSQLISEAAKSIPSEPPRSRRRKAGTGENRAKTPLSIVA